MFKRRLKTQNGFLLAAPAVLDLIFLLQIFFLIGDKVVVQEGITVSFPNTQEQEVETVADKIDAGARVIAGGREETAQAGRAHTGRQMPI